MAWYDIFLARRKLSTKSIFLASVIVLGGFTAGVNYVKHAATDAEIAAKEYSTANDAEVMDILMKYATKVCDEHNKKHPDQRILLDENSTRQNILGAVNHVKNKGSVEGLIIIGKSLVGGSGAGGYYIKTEDMPKKERKRSITYCFFVIFSNVLYIAFCLQLYFYNVSVNCIHRLR